jgi:hypothetical protein
MVASFETDESESLDVGTTFNGYSYPAVKAVAGAKGKYSSVAIDDSGNAENNRTHVVDYAGAAVATYTFQNGALGKLTSSCNVMLDGAIPVLGGGVLSKYSLPYTNSLNRKVSASMAIPASVAGMFRLETSLDDSGSKPISRYSLLQGSVFGCLSELEIAAKSPGGYVYRSDWADNSLPKNGLFGQWFGSGWGSVAQSKRYIDFIGEEKFTVGNAYTVEVVGADLSPLWSGSVTFDLKGVATVEEFASLAAAQRPISLTWAPTTGVITASAKVGLIEGQMTFNPGSTGKVTKLTGFALPAGAVEGLIGWAGIEGNNLSLRIRSY